MRIVRRRFIPDESVALDGDEIIFVSPDGDTVITRWKTLHPKSTFGGGVSCYYIPKGVKVSKIFDTDGIFLYYYCDIIDVIKSKDGFTFNDLLADVAVFPDGSVKVLDLAELADAYDECIIGIDIIMKALRTVDWLLNEIYGGRFGLLTETVDNVEYV
jgi:predicted RNA-binding protein associated with RNAse of E/G family